MKCVHAFKKIAQTDALRLLFYKQDTMFSFQQHRFKYQGDVAKYNTMGFSWLKVGICDFVSDKLCLRLRL